jgi:hypothetical protein
VAPIRLPAQPWELDRALAFVPAGWKLVPVEPTDDMLINVDEEVGGHCHSCTRWKASFDDCRRVWAEMLAASPAAPAQQAESWPCPKCGVERSHFPACAQDGCPLMLNGLTESETSATASVAGLVHPSSTVGAGLPARTTTFGALMAVTAEKNKLHKALELACGYLTEEQVAEIAAAMPSQPADSEPDLCQMCGDKPHPGCNSEFSAERACRFWGPGSPAAQAELVSPLDLFAEANAWMKATAYRLNENVPELLGWLTSAVNAHLERVSKPAAQGMALPELLEFVDAVEDAANEMAWAHGDHRAGCYQGGEEAERTCGISNLKRNVFHATLGALRAALAQAQKEQQ